MLTDRFPTAVRISGEVYPVNYDFRVGLKIMQAFEDSRLTAWEKQAIMIGLLFPNIPDDWGEAAKAAAKFLDCGNKRDDEPHGGKVYSFTRDSQYIYSAFLQTYGVDLQTEDMHWWKFIAMFHDLSPETSFDKMRVMRDKYNRGILSKEEFRVWNECRYILDLNIEPEDAETAEARENFERLLRR